MRDGASRSQLVFGGSILCYCCSICAIFVLILIIIIIILSVIIIIILIFIPTTGGVQLVALSALCLACARLRARALTSCHKSKALGPAYLRVGLARLARARAVGYFWDTAHLAAAEG